MDSIGATRQVPSTLQLIPAQVGGATPIDRCFKEASEGVEVITVSSDVHEGRMRTPCIGRSVVKFTVWTVTALVIVPPVVFGTSSLAEASGNRGTAEGSETVVIGTLGGHCPATTSMTFTSNTYQTSAITNVGTIALKGSATRSRSPIRQVVRLRSRSTPVRSPGCRTSAAEGPAPRPVERSPRTRPRR